MSTLRERVLAAIRGEPVLPSKNEGSACNGVTALRSLEFQVLQSANPVTPETSMKSRTLHRYTENLDFKQSENACEPSNKSETRDRDSRGTPYARTLEALRSPR